MGMAVFCSELPKERNQPHHTAPRQSASLRNPKSNTLLGPKIQDAVGGEGAGSHSPEGRRPFSPLSSGKGANTAHSTQPCALLGAIKAFPMLPSLSLVLQCHIQHLCVRDATSEMKPTSAGAASSPFHVRPSLYAACHSCH